MSLAAGLAVVILLFTGSSSGQNLAPSLAGHVAETGFHAVSISAEDLPEAPAPRTSLGSAETMLNGSPVRGSEDEGLPLRNTPKRMLSDEGHILASPVRIRTRDLRWLIPVAAATAASLATDSKVSRDVISHDPSFNQASDTTSGVLRDLLIAGPVALFGVGGLTGNNRQRETALLAGEAMVNAYVTDEGIKYVTLRERPKLDNYGGHFYSGDAASDPSFVSGHSIVAWSAAAAMAGAYTKPWQQVGLYTMASSVSITRVLAEQHFPTDVLLGSVSGWLIGHYVFRAHHSAFTMER